MELKNFIGKVVIAPHTGKRFLINEITSPEICVVTVEPEHHGYRSYYSYPTINGDPFSKGYLVFEDASLLEPFIAAFKAYVRTEDAYWEDYGYWMRRD